jgi:hypothetical protein
MLEITNLYFIMARRKLTLIFTPKTLEFMIEYTLMSSILNKICQMTTKPWEYPKNDTRLIPLKHLSRIKTWGIECKKAIDKQMNGQTPR